MVAAMFLFSLIIVLAFNFTFRESINSGILSAEDIAAPALWICFSFAAILGLQSSFDRERDRETLDGLLLCPVDRSTIYVGKVLSNFVFVFFVNVLSIMFFYVFFAFDFGGHLLGVLAVTFIGTFAFMLAGTLIAAISVNTRARAALLPILLLPLTAISIILPSVNATGIVISSGLSAAFPDLQIIAGFGLIFGAIGYLVFDYVLEG